MHMDACRSPELIMSRQAMKSISLPPSHAHSHGDKSALKCTGPPELPQPSRSRGSRYLTNKAFHGRNTIISLNKDNSSKATRGVWCLRTATHLPSFPKPPLNNVHNLCLALTTLIAPWKNRCSERTESEPRGGRRGI